ncbi:MAG: LysM peptidoglycan-binding domain-containing protein [Opitutaceae bacterium]|nr:LysM peptidoglycan-binding domain-containing protein [Opitutaceae bacterium]
MHSQRFCLALVPLALFALAPGKTLAAESAADTEAKLAGALRSFTLVQNENDDLKAQAEKYSVEKAGLVAQLATQLATLKNAVPLAAQAQSLREQLRQTQAQLAALSEENARLRTAIALSGPAPGALPSPVTIRSAAPVPPMAAGAGNPPAVAPAPQTHTIAAGDTLTRIAQKYYGTPSRWPEILAANRDTLRDEKSLSVGQTIRIP